MDFQRETLFDIMGEVEPLLDLHYEELTLHKEVIKLAPQWSQYAELERMGLFAVFTCRESGKLIGYNAFFVNRHIHYGGFTVAQNDVLFVHPEHRKGTMALRFLAYSEEQLKLIGAQKITYHIKFSMDWRPILHRKGYQDEEVMVAKLL